MESPASKWSSLPRDLLLLIAKRLQTQVDILRLRAVCCSLRSSVPLPLEPPIPISARRFSIPVTEARIPCDFLLSESTIYAIQSPVALDSHDTAKTWLVKVQKLESGKAQLRDPLSRSLLKNLSRKLPKSLCLLDYQVKEIAKAYYLELFDDIESKIKADVDDIDVQFSIKRTVFFRKVVVSPDGLAIMAATTDGELIVWRNEAKNWTQIDGTYFQDIVCYNEKFYALCSEGLVTVDSKSLNVTKVADQPRDLLSGVHYLVSSCKDLYLIFKSWCGFFEEEVYVIAFKLDVEKCEWFQMVDGLDNRVLFAGVDCSYSVSANDIFGCKENCSYISDGSFDANDSYYIYPGKDAGIFDLKDHAAQPLYAFPAYYKIFWPPPLWLKQGDE